MTPMWKVVGLAVVLSCVLSTAQALALERAAEAELVRVSGDAAPMKQCTNSECTKTVPGSCTHETGCFDDGEAYATKYAATSHSQCEPRGHIKCNEYQQQWKRCTITKHNSPDCSDSPVPGQPVTYEWTAAAWGCGY